MSVEALEAVMPPLAPQQVRGRWLIAALVIGFIAALELSSRNRRRDHA